MRYMDDITIFSANKKVLHQAIALIRQYTGQRFRLKLKRTYQVCRFHFQKGKRTIGRALDFMGFVFYRNRTLIRKGIMLSAVRTARKLHRERKQGGDIS